MNHKTVFCLIVFGILSLTSNAILSVDAQLIPDWIKNTAKWYGEGKISETEFLNAIKYLIDNNIIVLEPKPQTSKQATANIIIPNGNAETGNVGFYIPLNLEVSRGTTVIWINDDNIQHTVVSQDEKGNVIPLFNSKALKTGERFAHKFNEAGTYHYFCTIHPWRVGLVTVH
ncbi:MAG: plastocyanin/azurin family copper-binding protein [Candidatus Nitrosotenuis sp.]